MASQQTVPQPEADDDAPPWMHDFVEWIRSPEGQQAFEDVLNDLRRLSEEAEEARRLREEDWQRVIDL